MSIYSENEQNLPAESDAENTMAVLNTLGGGEDPLAEGEPLGLDPEAGKSKLSGSSLAVGVVVVLGVVALAGMKMTLKAVASGETPTDAIAEIDGFMANLNAAKAQGVEGPIKAPTDESQEVLEQLKQNPTDHQVPAEEVGSNPFDLSSIVATHSAATVTPDHEDPEELRRQAQERAQRAAGQLKIDSISGQIVFVNGELYRVGDKIGDSGFVLDSVDGLTIHLRTTDEYGFTIAKKYR